MMVGNSLCLTAVFVVGALLCLQLALSAALLHSPFRPPWLPAFPVLYVHRTASTNTIACGTTPRLCLHLRFPCPLRWRCVHARWYAVALIRCTSECVPYFACEL